MEDINKSKLAFISAAGELFALRGIDAVSIRNIAAAAGIDSSMIKYHFGNKEGLVQSVIEYAVRPWKVDNLQNYFNENQKLLETKDGQTVFVNGMVALIFKIFNSGEKNNWGKSFVLQLIQRPHPMRQEIIDKYIKPGIKTFYKIFNIISGNDDFDSAFCWYLFLICPMYIFSSSPGMIEQFHPDGEVASTFEQRLQLFTVRQMLSGFNLN